MKLWQSTPSLVFGVVKRFYFLLLPALLLPFDLAERFLGVTSAPPTFTYWVLFGFGLFLAVNLTYHEEWRKQRMPLAMVKQRIRGIADKGAQIQAESGNKPTKDAFDGWQTQACDVVEECLGKPQANTFQGIVENQLRDSPNDLRNALDAGTGWLNARAGQITESDVMPSL